MNEEVMEIKVEPELFIVDSFDDCEDVDNSSAKINNQTDAGCNSKKRGTKRCIYCGNVYKKKYISTHLRTHTGEKRYKCSWQEDGGLACGKAFMRLEHLQRHSIIHTGLKLHKCEICLKDFSRSDHLRKHMLIHLGIKPFSCEICSKTFGRPDHLRKHFQTHFKNTEKPTCVIDLTEITRKDCEECEAERTIKASEAYPT